MATYQANNFILFLIFFVARTGIRDPGFGDPRSGIWDPGWKKSGSGINIPELQHRPLP